MSFFRPSADWLSVPEGVQVIWNNLVLQSVENATEDQQASILWFCLKPKLIFVGVICLLSIGLCAYISNIVAPNNTTLFIVAAVVLSVIVFCAVGFTYGKSIYKKTKIGTFQGVAGDRDASGAWGRVLKRMGLDNETVVVKLSEAKVILEVNGRPCLYRCFNHIPVVMADSSDPEAMSLTNAEKYELKIKSDQNATLPFIAVLLLGVAVRSLSKGLNPSQADQGLHLVIGLAALVVAPLLFWMTWKLDSKVRRDIREGELEAVGNKKVLKHSRKEWTVDGKPASWRLGNTSSF